MNPLKIIELHSKLRSKSHDEKNTMELTKEEVEFLLGLIEVTYTKIDNPLFESLSMASTNCKCCGRPY
ncbi:hypothetical protein COL12_27565 [Bacillus cereus]|nr:hypothetical protein COL12_27565 [Bacillus cereus]